MIDNVKNWSYPFAGASGNPLANLTSLAKARGGFYPMGANGLWHGGVHFDQGTAGAFDQSSVRCIADGEVIAYRIDDKYPLSRYTSEIPLIKQAPFSTGFVLIKHRLELPPLSPTASTAAPPVLTFYSLYMHLQDWTGYLAKANLPRPAFWGEGIYRVKADAPDPVLGLNVRGHHKVPAEHAQYRAYQTILCTLPRGTRVEVGEASPDGNWLKLASVTPLAAGLAAATGWVFKGEMKSLAGNSYLIADQAKDVPASPQQGLNVRQAANSASDILAVLPHGTQVRIGSEAAASKYHRLVELVHGNPVPALTAQDDGKLRGFVWRDSLESTSEPKAKDSVVVLDSPVSIKAGELIGHLGLYQNHNQGAPQALLHLEVFSCEDVPAFIAQSRSHAARLPDAQKTLLKIHKGASKLIPHREGIDASNPPQISDAGVTVGVDLLLPQSLLDSLPADAKLLVPASTGGNTCSPELRWWRLDNLLADADGNPISGWLAEQEMITTRHSPWEWPGYDFIEDRERPAGALAYHLEALRRLTDGERANYQGIIDQSDKGPVKQRLYDILDGNGDQKITPEEIRTALGKPWHAQAIAQLITKHESEWLWNPSKWDELDELMEHSPTDPNPDWAEEKKRIETLAWWKELGVKHGIDAGGVVWHFQPISTLALFTQTDQLINADHFIEKYVNIHSTFNASAATFSQTSKNNLRTVIEHINKYYNGKHHQANLYELAYMFATARHEAWHFLSAEYFSAKPEIGNLAYFNKYDPILAATPEHRTRAINNENTTEGDGFKYRGRGLVHLTWKVNYRKAKEHFDINFVEQPDKAAEYQHAVPIMIWGMKTGIFTGHKLARYINASGVDYIHARKIINGSDQQSLIASYAEKFEIILRETSVAKETFNP